MDLSPEAYPAVLYLGLLSVFVFFYPTRIPINSSRLVLNSLQGYSFSAIILSVVIILFLGCRPIDAFFVDTIAYAEAFDRVQMMNAKYFQQGDVGFRNLMLFCSKLGLSSGGFLLLIEALYVGGISYVTLMLFRRNAFLVLIAVFSTFFFYNYGVNGIRSGLASSLMFVAIWLHGYKKRLLPSLIIFSLALLTHISTALVAVAYVTSNLNNKNRYYLVFWFVCLFLSLIIGRELEIVAMNAGVLDNWRSTSYLVGKHANMAAFSRIGYRWDFVLYSLPAVIWIWYWVVKRGFQESFFISISNVYLVINGLWLLVNQNWLSDRLAALSWFFHGFLFMYPLLYVEQVKYRRSLILAVIGGNLLFSIIYKVL